MVRENAAMVSELVHINLEAVTKKDNTPKIVRRLIFCKKKNSNVVDHIVQTFRNPYQWYVKTTPSGRVTVHRKPVLHRPISSGTWQARQLDSIPPALPTWSSNRTVWLEFPKCLTMAPRRTMKISRKIATAVVGRNLCPGSRVIRISWKRKTPMQPIRSSSKSVCGSSRRWIATRPRGPSVRSENWTKGKRVVPGCPSWLGSDLWRTEFSFR